MAKKSQENNQVELPKITVAFPTFNRDQVLLDSIQSVIDQNYPNVEILVIDQSTERSRHYLEAIKKYNKHHNLRYYLVSPPSVTAARNFALSVCQTELIIFLDDDVILRPNLIKNFALAMSEKTEVSAMAGRVMQEGFPEDGQILKFNDRLETEGVFTAQKSGETNTFPGGNCCLRVKDMLAVGGFDTRYYGNAFREESDGAAKLIKVGKKIYYLSTAEILHLAAPRGGHRVSGDIWDNQVTYENEIFFVLRHAPVGQKYAIIKEKFEIRVTKGPKELYEQRKRIFQKACLSAVLRLIKRQRKSKVIEEL